MTNNETMPNLDTFAKRLKWCLDERPESRMRQARFAEKVGISQPTVWSYREEGTMPKDDKRERIAEVLGVNALWLYFGRGPIDCPVPSQDPGIETRSADQLAVATEIVDSKIEAEVERRHSSRPADAEEVDFDVAYVLRQFGLPKQNVPIMMEKLRALPFWPGRELGKSSRFHWHQSKIGRYGAPVPPNWQHHGFQSCRRVGKTYVMTHIIPTG